MGVACLGGWGAPSGRRGWWPNVWWEWAAVAGCRMLSGANRSGHPTAVAAPPSAVPMRCPHPPHPSHSWDLESGTRCAR